MSVALTPAELAAIDTDIGTARGLPNRFYTCPQAAAFERDAVLGSTWMCIGFANDVPPGTARPLDVLGAPLAMVRAADGSLRVFHNVCRHRGHKLVLADCDLRGAIRCPYHSWTYGLDGALRGTPHIGGHGIHEIEGFDKAARGLFEVRSTQWMDMVFVNLSGDCAEFDDYIAPLVHRWEEFVGPGGLLDAHAAAEDRIELEVGCNWKLAVENYCESYHLPWIHPGLNSYSKIEDHYNILAGAWGAGQGTNVFGFSERAGIVLPRFDRWPQAKLKTAEYIALFPNVLLGLQNDHFYAIVLLPRAHNRTLERVQLYFVGDAGVSGQLLAARDAIQKGWRDVFLEDIGVCEGMQEGRASPAFDGGAFSPVLDNATHHFHRWVARRLAA